MDLNQRFPDILGFVWKVGYSFGVLVEWNCIRDFIWSLGDFYLDPDKI